MTRLAKTALSVLDLAPIRDDAVAALEAADRAGAPCKLARGVLPARFVLANARPAEKPGRLERVRRDHDLRGARAQALGLAGKNIERVRIQDERRGRFQKHLDC